MKPFPLDKVLEYRSHVRLDARNALAAAMADEKTLLDRKEFVEHQKVEQIEELSQVARAETINVEAAARRRYFAGQLDIQLLVLDEQIVQAQQVVEECRQVLVKADQDVKALERLREQHVEEETYHENRRSEIELGEQWQSSNWSW